MSTGQARDEAGRARIRPQHQEAIASPKPHFLLILCALPALAAGPVDARLLFARDAAVPPPVRAFAWRVIETRCNYQAYEREQRLFWAYDAQARGTGTGVVYSLNILSELPWRKAEPPALIEMIIVDDGSLRLTALKSSFVTCA
jgi:hypothetical protein